MSTTGGKERSRGKEGTKTQSGTAIKDGRSSERDEILMIMADGLPSKSTEIGGVGDTSTRKKSAATRRTYPLAEG